jgi:beta-xylosidase
VTASEGMRQLREAQRTVVQSSRLGIPAIIHEECLTGFTTFQATVYPAAIAWAATFDRDLIKEMASAIGRDMAAVGVHQGLSPVLDVVRDTDGGALRRRSARTRTWCPSWARRTSKGWRRTGL